jgi:hypothetical protein
METAITQQPNVQEIIEKKRKAWGELGASIYKAELELQVMAQSSLSKLESLPNKIEDVQAAELTLKEVKAEQKKIEEKRKTITGPVQERLSQLMAPEKSFDVPVTEYQKAIITVKQQYEQEQKKKQLKQDEYKRIREQLIGAMANYEAEYKTKIHDKVNKYYEYALQNIRPEQLEKFLQSASAKLTEADFTPPRPNPVRSYHSAEEIQALINECFVVNPEDYVGMYVVELEKRFSDFAIAFNNKAEAIRIANEEKERKQLEIQQQQQNTVVAAQLDAFTTTDMSVAPIGIKALKKCFKIDMPETEESAIRILSAYVANRSLCAGKVRITKWLNFSVSNAIVALQAVKNEDNNFNVTGLIWKEVEKL